MNDLIKQLEDKGYEVEWASGATPESEKQRQRESGWLWEGDDIPDDFPAHMVLKDDSHEPTFYSVKGYGLRLSINENDNESWMNLLEGHLERVQQSQETPEETAERLGIKMEREEQS